MKLHKTALALSAAALISGLSGVAQAQSTNKEGLAPANPSMMAPQLEGKGILTFASKTQDTGEILDTEDFKVSYLFRNTGAGPLTITQVKPACGCTVPELAKKTYMPGETGSLEVTFDPHGKKGPVARNITIFTDSDTTASETIVLRSLVKPLIVTDPMVLPFDAIDKGSSVTKEFKVYGRTDDFKVTRATSDKPEAFDVQVQDMGETELNGEMLRMSLIKVTVKPDARPDNYRTQLTVRTNDERKPILTLACVARVLGDLKVDPVRVTMGRMVVGDEFERKVNITSKSGKPFAITSAGVNNLALDATYSYVPINEEKTDWILTIKGKVVNAAPRFNTQIHVTTDMQDEEKLTIQMYGQLRAQ